MPGTYQYDPNNSSPLRNANKSFFTDPKAYQYEDNTPEDWLGQEKKETTASGSNIHVKASPGALAIARAQEPVRTSRDIINDIFSYDLPKPAYDPNRPEEIKRMMKLNAMGKGLSVLGDILSLSRGGNVVARPKDQTNKQLLSAYYNYLDRAATANDEWNYRDYANRIKKGLMELDQKNKEDKMDLDRTKLAYDINKDDRDFALKQKKTNADITLADTKQKATDAYNQARIAIQQGNIQLGLAKLDEYMRHNREKASNYTNKPFMEVSPDGKQRILLSEADFRHLYEQALQDPDFQGENLKAYMANFENQPLEAEKNIVQAYYSKINKQKDQQADLSSLVRPPYQGPVRTEGQGNQLPPQQPQQSQEKQYSTGGYY